MPSREQVLDRNQARTETAEERAARQMAAAYNQARREILARLIEGWTGAADMTPDAAASLLRQSGLLQQIDARLGQLEREVGITLRGIVEDSTDRALTAIRSELALLPASLRPNELNLFGTINTRMVEQFVPVAMSDWRGLTTSMASSLQRELQVGLIQGESFPALSRRLLGESPGEGAVFPRARTSADLATRRLVIQAENTAKQTAIAEVAGSIPDIGKQAIAAVGVNTTDCCLRVHGQVKPVDQPFELVGEPRFADQLMTSPFHWNCRTAIAMHHPFFEEAMPTDKLKADAEKELQRRKDLKEKPVSDKGTKRKSDAVTDAEVPTLVKKDTSGDRAIPPPPPDIAADLAAREAARRAEVTRAEAEAAKVAAEVKSSIAAKAERAAEALRARTVTDAEVPTLAKKDANPGDRTIPPPPTATAADALKSDIGDAIDEGAPTIPDLSQLTYVRELGGSTGAKLYQDTNGNRFVVKAGASEEHVRNEQLADDLYRAMNVPVPNGRLATQDGKLYKVTEFIEGRTLDELSGAELEAAREKLRQHFAADVLLRNWDVIGMGGDNILVDKNGQVWRIDNGGALAFRARGEPKSPSGTLDEIGTMRDKSVSRSSEAVFGKLQYNEIIQQLQSALPTEATVLAKIDDPALARMMFERYTHARKLIAEADARLKEEAERAAARRRAEEIAARARAEAERLAAQEQARKAAEEAARAETTVGFQYLPGQKQRDLVNERIDKAIPRAAARYKVTPQEYEQTVDAGFKKLVSSHDLAIQFKSENMDRFLADPRFKTQFETNSSGGALNQDYRASAEFAGLGAPLSLDPQQRPIYGYVNLGKAAQENVSQYGDITFILKDDIRKRTTATMDDSLYNFHHGYVAGTPIENPTRESWDGHLSILYDYAKDGNATAIVMDIPYVEIQIQGGVSLKDVRGVIDRQGRLTAAQRQQLKNQGIEIWDK